MVGRKSSQQDLVGSGNQHEEPRTSGFSDHAQCSEPW